MTALDVLRALDGAPDELGQVLAVLRAAGERAPEELSVAAGDRRLLDLQRAAVGADLELTVSCPACGALSSMVLDGASVPAVAPRCAMLGTGGGLREPTYRDLAGLPADPGRAAAELLRRCTVGGPERPATAEDLELVDDSLTGPVHISCSACGEAIEVEVDIERAALEAFARRLERDEIEVHLLASGYHWPLEVIEALPPRRRERLARMVAEGAWAP